MDILEAYKIRDDLIRYLSKGQIESGVEFFEKKSGEVPEIIQLECLGNISFYRRDIAEAVRFYEAANSLSPDYVIPRYFYLAGVRGEREGEFVRAFKYYQAAIEAEPSFVDPYVELGALLVKVGDFEGALKCYEDAVNLAPEELLIHENLKSVLVKLNGDNAGVYEEKLQAAKLAYEEVVRGGKFKPVPQQSHW
ncbi:tetratricopeptide repeat protein [Pseudomonas sp. CVAP|uniref:tetratricopeptide repeat protein n=1 Tax=Pseudomonas sp. CVAP\|nr:tetratricopeptide repeat protein [Pseudomonas sp. CVAP\